MKFILLLLCVPLAVWGRDVYQPRPLDERALVSMYSDIMRDACRHADPFWQDWRIDAHAGFWGSGRSDNMNEGIRAISGMTLTCAALLKYSDAFTPAEREEYQRKTLAAFRYATATHVSGTEKCPDGKPWGNSWQSAMWTGDLAFSAWLIWGEVDDSLRKDIERVVAYETDRFLSNRPPAGTFNDTKAEENGWNLVCISIAATMFPDHPHAAAWNEKAIEYMMNTLSAPQDADDDTKIDGKKARDWYSGANVHPDFTLENHGFFHPGYIGCSSYFLTQSAMFYTFAHRPVPRAATHHLLDVWRMFQGILLSNGESACPQGMDWELHGLPYINLFASLASYQKDALAARLETTYIQYMRAWQEMRHGDLAAPGSTLGFTRHAICAEQATYGFLAHQIFGVPAKPISAAKASAVVEGVRTFNWIGVVTHRTEDKFASFSWTNRIMGMVIPIGPGHEGNPDFTAPIVNGLVGRFDLVPAGNVKATVGEHGWKKTGDGFQTWGVLLLNGGRLRQTLRMTSIGEKAVVYEDRVVAIGDVTVAQECGVPLGIENDEITGGLRTVAWADGQQDFDAQHSVAAKPLPGSWANVDGRLGVVMIAGAEINYCQANNYQPGISVREDLLYGSYWKGNRSFKAGEEVAHRVAIIVTELGPQDTAMLARSCQVSGQTLRFKIPGQREIKTPLLN